jgi:hypothetical protein
MRSVQRTHGDNWRGVTDVKDWPNSLEAIPNGSLRSARTESSDNYVESAANELVVADDDTLLARRAAQAMTRGRDLSFAPRALRLPSRSRGAYSEGDENNW